VPTPRIDPLPTNIVLFTSLDLLMPRCRVFSVVLSVINVLDPFGGSNPSSCEENARLMIPVLIGCSVRKVLYYKGSPSSMTEKRSLSFFSFWKSTLSTPLKY